jgi:hypothetical protein
VAGIVRGHFLQLYAASRRSPCSPATQALPFPAGPAVVSTSSPPSRRRPPVAVRFPFSHEPKLLRSMQDQLRCRHLPWKEKATSTPRESRTWREEWPESFWVIFFKCAPLAGVQLAVPPRKLFRPLHDQLWCFQLPRRSKETNLKLQLPAMSFQHNSLTGHYGPRGESVRA